MKNTIIFAATLMMVTVFAACNGESSTPANDSTKLWPAYNASVNLYGYIDSKGEWAIPAQFTEASSFFSSGSAIVKIYGQNAFIDKKGKVQNCVSFDEASAFQYGFSRAMLNGKYGLINTNFEFAIQPVYANLSEMTNDGLVSYVAAYKKCGFMDKNGNVVTDKEGNPLFYESAGEFRDGYCVTCSDLSTDDGRIPTYMLINKKGEASITEGRFMDMQNMGKGIVSVVEKEKDPIYPYERHLLTADGSSISSKIYHETGAFSADNVAVVGAKDGDKIKYGYVDTKGKEVISLIYDRATTSANGYAWVLDDKTWKLIDIKSGHAAIICQPQTDNMSEVPLCGVHNGLTLIGKMSYSNYETSLEYRWVDVKNDKVVFSWNYNKDKNNGYLNPPSWAPARNKQDVEIGEYVFLK